jgi:hypothetical protein
VKPKARRIEIDPSCSRKNCLGMISLLYSGCETMEDNTTVSVCVGTFDQFGMPITITKHLSDCATIAFQAITLNLLISRALGLEAAEATLIHHIEGSTIQIDRTLKGFTGYIGTHDPK